jgi:hypothetical protein
MILSEAVHYCVSYRSDGMYFQDGGCHYGYPSDESRTAVVGYQRHESYPAYYERHLEDAVK